MKKVLIGTLALALASAMTVSAFAQDQPAGGGRRERAGQAQATAAQVVTVNGTIKSIEQPKNRTEVAFTVVDGAKEQHVAAAPQAYLTKIGLTLTEGMQVSVTGFQRTNGENTFIVARDITTGGKTFNLRNEAGRPLWNEFTAFPAVTLEGTVKDLVVPTPEAQPAAAPAQPAEDQRGAGRRGGRMGVTFTLVTAKDPVKVELGPAPALAQLGLALQEGAKVKIAGWQAGNGKNAMVVVRELTVDGKTYTLRDADGKPVWAARNGEGREGQRGAGNRQGGGQRRQGREGGAK